MTFEEAHEWFEYRDGKLYWKKFRSYNGAKQGDEVGCYRRGYRVFRFNHRIWMTHRVIWLMHNPEFDIKDTSVLIDHKNRIKDCNYIWNLREATKAQNAWNSKGHGKYLKGVTYYAASPLKKPWVAKICRNGTRKTIGYFETEEAAHQAYRETAKEYFGEFFHAG